MASLKEDSPRFWSEMSLLYILPMKSFIISILIAILAITYKDTITNKIATTNTTAFKGLPLFPPRAIYGAPKAANMTIPRAIKKAFLAREQSEGAGARVRRSIGTPQLKNFSPFLMLDHFTIKPGAGFPDHPHRGQETVCTVICLIE